MSQLNHPMKERILSVFLLLMFWMGATALSAQDEPCGAVNIPITGTSCVPMTGTTIGATASAGVTPPGCGDYQGGDLWYSVIMPNNGLQVVVELTSISAFDGGLAVYSGDDCGNLTLVSCDDNSGGGNNALIRIDDGCTFENMGQTFWIRVWENGNDLPGAFEICAYAQEAPIAGNPTACEGNYLAGDICCNAILLSADQLDGYCGNTGGYDAFPNNIDEWCANIENNVWIAFVPSSPTLEIEFEGYNCTSQSWQVQGGIQAHIFTTDDCVNFEAPAVSCSNPGIPTAAAWTATNLEVGQVYYMHIDGWNGDTCDYRINVISGVDDASATASDASICQGQTTELQAMGIGFGPFTYSWSPATDLDDPNAQNPTASPTASTTYTVTIDGPSESFVRTVDVEVLPALPTSTEIVENNDNSVCQNTVATYEVVSPNATNYLWTVTGGGTIVGDADNSTVVVDWGTATTVQVCVVTTNNCGNGPQDCIIVNATPQTSVDADNPDVACAPETVNLSTIPLNISGAIGSVSYHETLAGAEAGWPILNPPVVDTTGTYYIRVQTSQNCYDVESVYVNIEYVDVEVRQPQPTCQPNVIDLSEQVTIITNGWIRDSVYYFSDSLDAVNMVNPMTQPSGDVITESGTYWARFETPNGCFDVDRIDVTIERVPDLTITQHPFVCPGSPTDLANVPFTDANMANITETFFFNNEGFALSGLTILAINSVVSTPGDYYVLVRTPQGCFDVETITVTETTPPVGQIDGSTSVCPGSDAELFFDLNGTGPFDIVYTDGTDNFTLTGINDGDTEMITINNNTTISLVSVDDATGCPGNIVGGDVVFDLYTPPTAQIAGTNAICGDGTTDLTFNLTGTGPFTVVYSDGSTDYTLNNITDGHAETVNITQSENFSLVSVVDNNGCDGNVSGTADVTYYDVLTITNINETCNASFADYTLTFEIEGGDAGSYNVSGIGGSLVGNLFTSDPIPSGTVYNVTISDNSACPPVSIDGVRNCGCTTHPGTMATAGGIDVCEGGNAVAGNLHQNDEVLNGGDLLMFVLHDNAGSTVGNILSINATGSFNFLPGMSFGTTYYISPIAGPDLGSGTIDLGHTCTSITPGVPVIFHETPFATISGVDQICRGDTALITFNFTAGTAPFDVVYTDGNGNNIMLDDIVDGYMVAVDPLISTTYSIVSVMDNTANFCMGNSNGTATVDILSTPFAENIERICNSTNTEYQVVFNITSGDPASYLVIGDGTYDAATNTFTSNPIPSGGAYAFMVDDANGCEPFAVEGAFVCDCTTQTVDMDSDLLNVCDGTTAVAGYTGTPVLDGDDVLAFVLHDGNTIQIGTVFATSSVPEFDYDPALTYGDIYYISAVVGNDDGTGVPILDHSLNPCLSIAAGQPVVFTPSPTINIVGDTTVCAGEVVPVSFEIGGVGPYDVVFTDGTTSFELTGIENGHTELFTPLDTTTYSLVSIQTADAPNCAGNVFDGIQNITVNVRERPEIVNIVSECNAAGTAYTLTFDITGGNPMMYQVSGNPGALVGNTFTSELIPSGDIYYFEINDGMACAPVIISEQVNCNCTPDIMPAIAMDTPITCPEGDDGILTVTPQNGIAPYSYEWSNGMTGDTATRLAHGWHYVTMTDGNGCLSQDSFLLRQPDPLEIGFDITDVICNGGNDGEVLFVNPRGGAGDYLFNFDQRVSYIENRFFNMTAGTYIATMTDANGCMREDTIVIAEPDPIIVDLGPDQELDYGDSIELVPQFNQAVEQIVWHSSSEVSPPDTNEYFAWVRPWKTTTYVLEATNEFGCTGEGSVKIILNDTLPVFIPNVFSPNRDGNNDRWQVFTGLGVAEIISVQVFNRWGAMVYREENINPRTQNFGWNGQVKGRLAATGVYIYSVAVRFEDGEVRWFEGDVTLLR